MHNDAYFCIQKVVGEIESIKKFRCESFEHNKTKTRKKLLL